MLHLEFLPIKLLGFIGHSLPTVAFLDQSFFHYQSYPAAAHLRRMQTT